MESLTLEAAKLAEHSRVQYCNFTLRPLSYEVNKPDAGMPSVCTCASPPMIMESAVMSRRESENREDQVV
jgi:hypothetical protein